MEVRCWRMQTDVVEVQGRGVQCRREDGQRSSGRRLESAAVNKAALVAGVVLVGGGWLSIRGFRYTAAPTATATTTSTCKCHGDMPVLSVASHQLRRGIIPLITLEFALSRKHFPSLVLSSFLTALYSIHTPNHHKRTLGILEPGSNARRGGVSPPAGLNPQPGRH
jgi:hypothetical protein